MSSVGVADEVCANCGKAAADDIKLKLCTACRLIKYCSVECQKNHRSKHKKECKKRAAEIKDDKLFTQPDESHLGECPICCLPNPLDMTKSMINSCCGKRICDGCSHANKIREREQGLGHRCPYCREQLPKTQEEIDQNQMKRVKANDPVALFNMGTKCDNEGNYEEAFKYFTKAADLGYMNAHFNLSIMYKKGDGVEKDQNKKIHHLEKAAIGGHPEARYNLGCMDGNNKMPNRAVKHWIIAANLGYDKALEAIRDYFSHGVASKEDFEAALRGHQAAVDATKSEQREEAYAQQIRW